MPIEKLRPTFTFDEDRLAELKQVVPEAFADGKVNWEVLREALGGYLEDADEETERFGLFWPGKRDARQLASESGRGTLVPVPGLGVNEESTRNIFIEGENLEVLKSLRKSYAKKVKMIYIDPPYNTGKDRIYRDDYSEPLESYLERTGQAGEEGQLLTSNTRASGRFHSNWLSMMYPRIRVARDLLSEDGVIFISIGEREVAHLRQICDELFGEEALIGMFAVKTPNQTEERNRLANCDYLISYRNTDQQFRFSLPEKPQTARCTTGNPDQTQPEIEFPAGVPVVGVPDGVYTETRKTGGGEDIRIIEGPIIVEGGELARPVVLKARWSNSNDLRNFAEKIRSGSTEPLYNKFGKELTRLWLKGRRFQPQLDKVGYKLPESIWSSFTKPGSEALEELVPDASMDYPKHPEFVREIVRLGSDRDAIVMDFFAGSCTTAQAVLELNRRDNGRRRFIMVQLPEPIEDDSAGKKASYDTVAEIGRQRIRAVIARVRDESKGTLDLHRDEDLGFKCYRLARSNYKRWEDITTPASRQIEMAFDRFETPLVEDWERDDLFTEVLLIEGFPLDSSVKRQQQFKYNQVDLVTSDFHEHRLFVCLDGTIALQTIAELDLADTDVFVCLDTALSDEAKVRLSDTGNIHVI
ncbi:MAG: site-specific DNA-methyltransferase [bacterium]